VSEGRARATFNIALSLPTTNIPNWYRPNNGRPFGYTSTSILLPFNSSPPHLSPQHNVHGLFKELAYLTKEVLLSFILIGLTFLVSVVAI
jgi:hypothetical protein